MNVKRVTVASLIALAVIAGSSACEYERVPADQVGLKYKSGPQDGNKFEKCLDPGTSDDVINDNVYRVSDNLRTWNINPTSSDQNTPIHVMSAPEPGMPSGIRMALWGQINLKLNTNCDDIPGYPGGTLRKWWEVLGKRYGADTEEGWRNLLLNTVVPALNKAVKDQVRQHTSDALEANRGNIYLAIQNTVSENFTKELNRLAGGQFFCGPSFTRDDSANSCPDVELIVTDVDIADTTVQEARTDRQRAIEQAAKLQIETDAQIMAQNKLRALYKDNPGLLALELEKLRLAQIDKCAQTKQCIVIMPQPGANFVLQVPAGP